MGAFKVAMDVYNTSHLNLVGFYPVHLLLMLLNFEGFTRF